MHIVLISGSPRKNGNSAKIIERAETFFKEKGVKSSKIKLSEVSVSPCIHCDFCAKNETCSQDPKANEVNEIMASADAIIIASPVYFGGMSGQLKCLLDKTLPLRRHGFRLKGKIGAAIATGGSRNGGQELTVKDIHAWMLVHGMVPVGDNSHFGGAVHNPVDKDDVGINTVDETFKAVYEMLNRLS